MSDEAIRATAQLKTMADALEQSAPIENRRRATIAATVVVAIAIVAMAVYVAMLTSPERASGPMLAGVLTALAIVIGLPCVLFCIFTGERRWHATGRLSIESCVAGALGLAVCGLPLTSWIGARWYVGDQIEAKAFVDRRIAVARAIGPAWPTTQAAFVGGEPLPRLLRGRPFYSGTSDGDAFKVLIPVDWDGGWRVASDQPVWRRDS